MNLIPRLFSFCRLIHEVKVSGMQRHKLEVQSSNSTCPNTDNFHLIVVSLSFNGKTWRLRKKNSDFWSNSVYLNVFSVEKQHVMLRTGILRTVEPFFGLVFVFMEMRLLAGVTGGRKIKFWRRLCFTVWLFSFFCVHLIRQIQLVRGFSQWMMCRTVAASTALWISMAAEKALCRLRCAITFILLTAR